MIKTSVRKQIRTEVFIYGEKYSANEELRPVQYDGV